MKEKKTKRGNQPYYAQYLTNDTPPANQKKAAPKRSAARPQEEQKFTKPTGYKSSFKGNNTSDKPFERRNDEPRPERKPYDSEKRPFNKPFERRNDEPRAGRKPYDAEKRPFNKPFERRNDEPRAERKPYDSEKRPFNKPFERRNDEPRAERKPYDSEKRPFERRNDEPRAERKPYDSEKRPFNKREEETEQPKRPRTERDGGESRRVGDLTEAPRYNMERAVDRLPGKKKPVVVKQTDDDLIRLNRYISNAGVCSRREADDLIGMGQVSVNGKVVTELGTKVKRSDVIKYAGRTLNPEKMVYILVNKPKDYITTTEDPEDRHTVMELIAGACSERVYPVGRLDRNTTGLLLFTNDGSLAEKLMHPSNEIQKIYQVELDKPITTEHFEAIKEGLELEDGFIKPDEVGIVTPDAMVLGLEIHSGRNRIVRRIFEHLGYEVLKLDRTAYAGLNKKELPRGKWRFLDEREVVRLKYLL
jgi:23S rRNA pseudouridine2605 synthase